MRCNQTVPQTTAEEETRPVSGNVQLKQTDRRFGLYHLKDVSVLYFVLYGIVVRHDSTHNSKPVERTQET